MVFLSQGGIWGTHLFLNGQYGPVIYITIGFVKLLAISITVLSGQFLTHVLSGILY